MFKKKALTAEELVREAVSDSPVAKAARRGALLYVTALWGMLLIADEPNVQFFLWNVAIACVIMLFGAFGCIEYSHPTRKRYANAIIKLLAPEVRIELARIVAKDGRSDGKLYNHHLHELIEYWDRIRAEQRSANLVTQLAEGTEHLGGGKWQKK